MPLFGRKHVGFVSPPSELSPNEEVFVIEQTNEAFRDYEDYVRRIELYELPCWTCKLTNQTNLTYFKALKSEEKARKGQPAMKRCFKKPILNVVHHSNDRFDDIVDDAHEHVQTIFAEGELVETKREGSDEAEEATVVKVIPPEEEDPDDPEPEPFFYDVEFKKDKSIRKNVNSDDISRLQRAPSKETIKLFVRDSTIRIGKPESMLWIVHKHLTEEFDIPDKLASDVQLPNLPVWPTVLPPKRLSVAGSGAPGPASLKEAKTKKEKAVSRVAKSLQRILDGVSGESKAKVEKGKNGPMKQATLHQFGLASPKPALPNPSAGSRERKVEDDLDDVGSKLAVNPLPKWKPKSVFEQLCSSASRSNSKLYRNLLKSAAMTLTPSQMERLPSPERKKVERKKWVMMSEEEKQKVKEQRKEKAKREREEKKKVIPDEELLASADPLPDGVPILLPETLESSDFPDLVLVTEFLHHFQELLCPDETQQRAVSLESLATALTTGMDGFGVVSGVLVSLLQLLLTEVPTRHKLFSLPVRACPLSLYTVSDLLRIYFEQFRVSAEKPSRSPVDSDDSDDDGANSSGGEEKAKKEEPVASDQEDEEDDKIDKDNIITPELLRLIDSLDQMEFCELNAREKLQIMVCLCHKTLYSDAVDDFLDEKKKKLQEIWKDDRAERAEERALLKKEREKRKEEGTTKKTSSTTANEKAPPASSENQSVITFSKEVETKDKESSLAIAEAENGKRRRVSVIEAQAIRERKERQMREKRDEEMRLRRQELDKRKAESKKVARKDEAVQCRKVHRLEPLGCDRSFRRYWLFDSAFPGVYAEVGWALGEENRWVHFDTVERLERLVDSLSTRGQREKALKANLAEAVKVVQEQFQSYGSRISSRNREKDSIQALKDGLIALVKKLGRKRLITGEDQAKFERRIDSANGLEDLIPLVIDCQEAIGEVCLKGTLLPDETKSSSRQKEKENLLEQWRDAVLGTKTLSKVHLLVSVLDVSIRWEKGVKIVHQPKRRISLRRAAAAKTSYKEVEEVGDDEDDEEADNESGAAESSDSESNDDDGDDGETTDSSDTLSPDESAPPKRTTRASARATAGRKVVVKSSKGGRVLRSNTRGDTGTAVSSRTRRRIESENEEEDEEENDEDGSDEEEFDRFESRPGRRKRAKKSRPPADEGRRTRRKRRHFDSEDSTSAVRRTRRADVDLRADMKVCEEIVGHLLSAESCWPFLRPVSKKETPDYFDIITNPMDFGTIREKLDLAQYVSLKAFLSDVRLVFFNCDAYNQATSDVGLAGRELESLFIRYLDEKLPNAAYMPVFDVADVREGSDGHSKKRSRRGAKV